MENRKIKKPYIKVVRDSCLWDYGRWECWGIIRDSSPFFFATSGPTKPRKHLFSFYFLNIGPGSKKKKWSPHFSKQLIPGLFYLEPHRKVSATELYLFTKNDQTAFKPWLFDEIWVSKTPGFVPGSPPGGLYFQKWPPKKLKHLWKSEKPKIQETLHKSSPGLMFMGFW